MFRNKRTLVTGAGSSIDICNSFLSGKDLLVKILDLFNDEFFRNQILNIQVKEGVISHEVIEYFKNQLQLFIKHSEKKSIDEFLSEVMTFPEHNQYMDLIVVLGKYAIFYSIVVMENAYLLKMQTGECQPKSWLNTVKEEFISGDISNIITFNYDRVFEHVFNVGNSEDILHVYGTITIDKWPFGKLPININDVYSNLGNFKIVNDRVPHETVKSFGGSGISYVYNSIFDQCFIMGFGFDFFNVRNLGLLNISNKHYYGNIYDHDQESVFYAGRRKMTEEIRRLVPEIKLQYSSCDKFISFMREVPHR